MPFSFAAGDETGQTGFKFKHGSTKFFVVTIILTNEPQMIRDDFYQMRNGLKRPSITEFKFHSTPHRFRTALLKKVGNYPLIIRSLYVDKPLLPQSFRQLKSWEFYSFFVAQLLDRLPVGELGHTTLVLDEFGPLKITQRSIRKELKRVGLWGNKPRVLKRITFRRSQSDELVQIADLCGGAIYRRLTQEDDTYYNFIKDRTLVWQYRPPK